MPGLLAAQCIAHGGGVELENRADMLKRKGSSVPVAHNPLFCLTTQAAITTLEAVDGVSQDGNHQSLLGRWLATHPIGQLRWHYRCRDEWPAASG